MPSKKEAKQEDLSREEFKQRLRDKGFPTEAEEQKKKKQIERASETLDDPKAQKVRAKRQAVGEELREVEGKIAGFTERPGPTPKRLLVKRSRLARRKNQIPGTDEVPAIPDVKQRYLEKPRYFDRDVRTVEELVSQQVAENRREKRIESGAPAFKVSKKPAKENAGILRGLFSGLFNTTSEKKKHI